MGILDSLPHPWPPLGPELCEAVETSFVRWRWRLREHTARLSRTHGDFHPWNILFREDTDFSVLDRSRGEWGEPADDVAALAINYLFFGMRRAAAQGERGVAEPFRTLFHTFLSTYVERTHDWALFDTLPPFLAFRALVLAHPRWYPDLAPAVRDELIHLAIYLAASRRFDPGDVARLCGAAR
jgi:Ser/Thr protein kinase RdoA (MazF antagonist)